MEHLPPCLLPWLPSPSVPQVTTSLTFFFFWKGKFALFWMPAHKGVGGGTPVQRLTPSLPPPPPRQQSAGKSFYRRREGATCRNSTVSSDSHLEIGHCGLTSIILIVLSTVNLQFQGWFVPISLIAWLLTSEIILA